MINLIVRPSPKFLPRIEQVKERMEEKKWMAKWPKLKFSSEIEGGILIDNSKSACATFSNKDHQFRLSRLSRKTKFHNS